MAAPLTLMEVPLGDLKPSPRNARMHSARQIKQIAASIEAFGFTNPVLVDEHNILVAGRGRLEAAKRLGMSEVPAIRVAHLSEAEKRALVLADNKIAPNAGWDLDILASELEALSSLDLEINLTGLEVGEIDLIIQDQAGDQSTEPELAPLPDPTLPSIARAGDVWLLGRHRVMCGDALSETDLASLMQGDSADVGFADPPYNVPINGHVTGKGQVQHREFVQASGEMTEIEFADFLSRALLLGAQHSRDGAAWFACMDWRHMGEMLAAGTQAFDEHLNLCVWAKTNGGMGSLYRSQHELVFVFRKGKAGHRNNVQLGRFGRNRTNLWTYPGLNTFREGRIEELVAHPTAKPVAMIKDALLDVSARGEIVLDPFLGAGATLMAAEDCGRIACGLELDPAYVDVTLRRWRSATGEEPVRQRDGYTLEALEADANEEVAS